MYSFRQVERILPLPRIVPLPGRFAGQDQPGVSFLENVRLLGTICKCQKSARRRVLGRGMEGVRLNYRNIQEWGRLAVSKRSTMKPCVGQVWYYIFSPLS